VLADSASEIVKFIISIPRESCTNAKAKYSSSVVPPDPSVHFYDWSRPNVARVLPVLFLFNVLMFLSFCVFSGCICVYDCICVY